MAAQAQSFSKIKEVASTWGKIRQLLRSGDGGDLVPVVIPKHRRGFGWLYALGFAAYLFGTAVTLTLGGGLPSGAIGFFVAFVAIGFVGLSGILLWRGVKVEIEQGTVGILSRYGKIVGQLPAGRHFLWSPWEKVEYIVDTATEIPYTAPVLACPTKESVPLKSIEFFLKFRIVDPIAFVRHIGASNFDAVLSSAVQDAIRQRSRQVQTALAYDLRGSDVGDMQNTLNNQLKRYGVRIIGANIPDVQLPDQYQQNLATRERIAKELVAYEKEWELVRKRRIDNLQLEIERAKKEHDAKLIAVKASVNQARESVAQMLQEKETDAEKVRLEIEAHGRAELSAAENEARALTHLGKSYRDNQAILQYELAKKRLDVAQTLVQEAPRPIIVNSDSGGDASPLAMLMMAEILPGVLSRQEKSAQLGSGGEQSRRSSDATDEAAGLIKGLSQAAPEAIRRMNKKK
ncbi:MAG TPA: SPFH domain-containing protein [Anaerolineae bacterium]|nr:SPFH domain-containing protein [Anaerolineae bacterium]